MRSSKQAGFALTTTMIVAAAITALIGSGAFFGFREFKANYLEIGERRAIDKFRDQVDSLKKDLEEKRKEIEGFAIEKADAIKQAQDELKLSHQIEVDSYKNTVAAITAKNQKLIAELTKAKAPSDRPVVNTQVGKLSDVAVNSINRMLSRFDGKNL